MMSELGNDGNLRKGFTSTAIGRTKGWFCITEFELYYLGYK